MAHHAFITIGSAKEAEEDARGYAARVLQLTGTSADIQAFSYGLFSVDDVRRIADAAYASAASGQKMIILYAGRLFHEAQNALLKLMEEPPAGVTIVLGVPSLGMLIPTLHSRLIELPRSREALHGDASSTAHDHHSGFLELPLSEREKAVAKLLDRAKSDDDAVKQEARGEAARLLDSVARSVHELYAHAKTPREQHALLPMLRDLSAFAPLMHERSTPLKPIFEHILITLSKTGQKGAV